MNKNLRWMCLWPKKTWRHLRVPQAAPNLHFKATCSSGGNNQGTTFVKCNGDSRAFVMQATGTRWMHFCVSKHCSRKNFWLRHEDRSIAELRRERKAQNESVDVSMAKPQSFRNVRRRSFVSSTTQLTDSSSKWAELQSPFWPLFEKMGQPRPLFRSFSFFRTRIVGEESKNADH